MLSIYHTRQKNNIPEVLYNNNIILFITCTLETFIQNNHTWELSCNEINAQLSEYSFHNIFKKNK